MKKNNFKDMFEIKSNPVDIEKVTELISNDFQKIGLFGITITNKVIKNNQWYKVSALRENRIFTKEQSKFIDFYILAFQTGVMYSNLNIEIVLPSDYDYERLL